MILSYVAIYRHILVFLGVANADLATELRNHDWTNPIPARLHSTGECDVDRNHIYSQWYTIEDVDNVLDVVVPVRQD